MQSRDERSRSPEGGRHSQRHRGDPRVTPESLAKYPRLYSLKEYLEVVEPNGTDEDRIVQGYRRYKEMHTAVQKRRFFDQHKAEEWFVERYHPDLRMDAVQSVRSRYQVFCDALREGKLEGFSLCDEGARQSALEALRVLWPERPTLAIRSLPPDIRRSPLLKWASRVEGFEELVLGEPSPLRRFYRCGWVVCREGTELKEQPGGRPGVAVEGHELHVSPEQAYGERTRVSEYGGGAEEHLERAARLARKLDQAVGLETVESTLDQTILYLRTVHLVCYYCGTAAVTVQDLLHRCGSLHFNVPSPDGPLPPMAVLPSLGLPKTSETEAPVEVYAARLVEERDGGSSCVCCSKLFQNSDYAIKHLVLKHEDTVARTRDEYRMYQVYESCHEWDKHLQEQASAVRRDGPDHATRRRERERETPQDQSQPRKLRSYRDLDASPKDLQDMDYSYSLKP